MQEMAAMKNYWFDWISFKAKFYVIRRFRFLRYLLIFNSKVIRRWQASFSFAGFLVVAHRLVSFMRWTLFGNWICHKAHVQVRRVHSFNIST